MTTMAFLAGLTFHELLFLETSSREQYRKGSISVNTQGWHEIWWEGVRGWFRQPALGSVIPGLLLSGKKTTSPVFLAPNLKMCRVFQGPLDCNDHKEWLERGDVFQSVPNGQMGLSSSRTSPWSCGTFCDVVVKMPSEGSAAASSLLPFLGGDEADLVREPRRLGQRMQSSVERTSMAAAKIRVTPKPPTPHFNRGRLPWTLIDWALKI